MTESEKTTATVAVTDDSFADDVLSASLPVLVDFWASWCGPCHQIAQAIEDIAKDKAGELTVAKLDVDANPKITSKYEVRGIPTLLLFRDGKVVKQIVGAASKATILRTIADEL